LCSCVICDYCVIISQSNKIHLCGAISREWIRCV